MRGKQRERVSERELEERAGQDMAEQSHNDERLSKEKGKKDVRALGGGAAVESGAQERPGRQAVLWKCLLLLNLGGRHTGKNPARQRQQGAGPGPRQNGGERGHTLA